MRLLSEQSATQRDKLGKSVLTLNSEAGTNSGGVTPGAVGGFDGANDTTSEAATTEPNGGGSTKLKLNLSGATGMSGGSEAAEALEDGEDGELLDD